MMKPKLDWSSYENEGLGDAYADIPKQGGNFAKAIAVCINSMVCLRPIDKGVMCPSFRVRQDAAFSPGGRSRLLKKWLNDEITEEEKVLLDQSMSACVGCKGCKRECDTGLDIAAIRSEYLANHQEQRYSALRDKLFANLPLLLRFPKLAGLAISWRNNSSILSRLTEKLLGISADVKLPLPSTDTINSQSVENNKAFSDKTVVLLMDSITKGFSPEVIASAYSVLEKTGYDVRLAGTGQEGLIEGRTWFSAGYVEKATDKAELLLDQLTPYLDADLPIIGLEPASTLMLRDEYKMLISDERADKLATQTFLFEEFLSREISAGRFTPHITRRCHQKILIHGHCHQKSVGAMKSVRKVLKLVPDLEFEMIDSSCCGGGGSFAYEAENQSDSEQMYNLILKNRFESEPEALIVTNGFSCKNQIKQYSDRPSIHLAELLHRML